MKSLTFYVTVMGALTQTIDAAACGGTPGKKGGQCVQIYRNSGGNSCALLFASYQPTCNGNCYQYNYFDGLVASGDGNKGTNCMVYSDDSCNNYIGQTGNTVGHGGCNAFPGAQSMKCYFNC